MDEAAVREHIRKILSHQVVTVFDFEADEWIGQFLQLDDVRKLTDILTELFMHPHLAKWEVLPARVPDELLPSE